MQVKHIFIPLVLAFNNFACCSASCPTLVTTTTFTLPTIHYQPIALPPQFTDMKVDCSITTDVFCATSLNVTDSTVVLDTTVAGEYTNLNDYNFLRSNRSIFPTFDNELILTPTYVDPIQNNFGAAVAISGDGSILAIGSPNYATLGRVDIYQRRGSTWVNQQAIFSPPPNFQGFGAALSLSYDGSILAVGAASQVSSSTPTSFTGIFMYQYSTTTNRYTLIQAINGESLSGLANALQLSATGQYLVVANDFDRVFASNASPLFNPSARVYMRITTCSNPCMQDDQWKFQADLHLTTIAGTLFQGLVALPSQNVAISGDGTTIALSWPNILITGSPISSGVTIFKRQGSSWQQTQLLLHANAGFGTSVSLSNDGSYLAVGSLESNNLVYIFALRGTQYTQEAAFAIPRFNPSDSAVKVYLSADGTVVAVGTGRPSSTAAASQGSVVIALRGPNNIWSTPFIISKSDGSNLGSGIACSADGAFVVAGAWAANSSQGAAYIYRPVGSFVPNDTVVTGSLCVYNRTTIDATLRVKGNIHLNGTILTGTGGQVTACATALSDKRVKTDITPLNHDEALARLRALQPVTFDWTRTSPNTEKLRSRLRRADVGFIAQKIEKIFPHWVSTMPALAEHAQLIDDGNVKMLAIKPELYAYLVAALEQLVQKNTALNEELKIN